ncbi:hypothetical protein Vadar_023964 [Vaccinium darrowii]|uniref:Uncharacterized protein n=1 Tax=Vaccinium darrowii TaxID=229202 RepID=A0ACB7YFV7_9ERIC|nr:hypothetical protein Vadar_023964 [Vaccinium darrowii]
MADPTPDSTKEFRQMIWHNIVEISKPSFVDYFPALEKIDPQGIRRRLTSDFGETFELLGRLIDERLVLRILGKTKAEEDVTYAHEPFDLNYYDNQLK